MRALVIGGSGFIGSHIVDELLAHDHRVRVFDRAPERFRDTPDGVEFVEGDLRDTAALGDALDGVDWVLHAASTTVPATSNADPVADIEGNLVNAVRLLELMRKASVKRIIYLSSGGTVYGVPDAPIVSEGHPLRPISSYGVIKVAVENYLFAEKHLHGLRPLILRPSNPYGPRQGRAGVQGVIGTFLHRAAQGVPLEVWGDGKIIRDFFYVDDLARLCVRCMEADLTGVYNAGFGDGWSVQDVLEVVREVTQSDLKVVHKASRGFDVPKIVLDTTAIRERMGWRPETALAEGVALTWEWMRAHAD